MPRHEILLPIEPYTAKPGDVTNTHVQVTVRYDKGGMCYATYKQKPRGYYLSAGLIRVEEHTRCFGLFSAPTVVLEQAKRLSQKRLDELFVQVTLDVSTKTGKVQELIDQVLAKGGVKLSEAIPV